MKKRDNILPKREIFFKIRVSLPKKVKQVGVTYIDAPLPFLIVQIFDEEN